MKNLLTLALTLTLISCGGREPVAYNETDYANGGPDAPWMNERTAEFMNPDNQYADVDVYQPVSAMDDNVLDEKWTSARVDTHWQEYRGHMVRVRVLLGDSDLREMQLRLMQSSKGSDINADSRTVLNHVADFEMQRVCGRNATTTLLVYDRPSADFMRPTPYFDHQINAAGNVVREYGFRCVYEKQ
ncbi:MAG: hypothetical protein LBR41_00020 [Rickettsiales bacterium]|nr:hypothetical protein [Rickettsiales bacterium]